MSDLKIILDNENSQSQPLSPDLWHMSFQELCDQEGAILAAIQTCDDPVRADEFIGLLQTVRELKGGKIDRIAELIKKVIPTRRDALKEAYNKQLESLNMIEDKLKNLVIESIQANQATKLEGVMWQARVQSTPSVHITDDQAVPTKYREVTTQIKLTYTADHDDARELVEQICGLIEALPNCNAKIDIKSNISKTMLRSELKSTIIPGAELVRNPYIRFDTASALPITPPTELLYGDD